jgi:hypothetical protein
MLTASPSRAVSLGSDANTSNLRTFWRLNAWGAGAALALVVAVMAGRTELGAQRAHAVLTAMLSPPPSPDQQMSDQMAAWSSGFDKQMRRQAEIIRTLTEQRDDLADKVGALERQVNELGGTMARTSARLEGEARSAQQAAAAASVAAASASRLAQMRPDPARPDPARPEPARLEPPESSPQAVAANVPLTPSPVRTVTAPQPAPQPAPSGAPLNLLPPGQIHPATIPAAGFPTVAGAQPTPTYTGTVPMPAAPEGNGPPGMMRPFPVTPPSPSAAAAAESPVPLPRPAVKPSQPGAPIRAPLFQSNPLMTTGIFDTPADTGAIAAPTMTEYAIDLGAAATIEALRTRWSDLKVSQSPLLDNLRPLVALKESRSGQELHLVAGPLTNNAAGARLCAVLSSGGLSCQPTLYEGQRLAAR